MRSTPTLLAFALAMVLASSTASADRRAFTRTYEYMTMPEGETELEVYSTQTRSTWDDPATKEFQLQLEFEHGITERWDISMYHVFEQVKAALPEESEAFHFAEIKLRTRYRFAERGELPVDMLVYAEAVKEFGAGVYEAELKGIFARDFGQLTAAVNPIAEVKFGPATAEPEVELGYAVGLTYEIIPEWKVGAETWGFFALEEEDGEREVTLAAGPSVSWAPASTFWLTTTAGFALNDQTEAFSLRFLLGVQL